MKMDNVARAILAFLHRRARSTRRSFDLALKLEREYPDNALYARVRLQCWEQYQEAQLLALQAAKIYSAATDKKKPLTARKGQRND